MNILKELKSRFNCTEPIFDYELKSLGYTDKDISDTLKENEFEEIDIDKSFCIPCKAYTLVDYIEMFDMYSKVYGKSEQLIYKYYIGNNNEYGYFDYLTLYNRLGLSTQVSYVTYIKSNRANNDIDTELYKIRYDKDYKKADLPYIYLSTVINFKYNIEYDKKNIYNKFKDIKFDREKLENMIDISRRGELNEFFTQYQ